MSFSFLLYQIHSLSPKYSWTCGLQKRIQSWVGREGKIRKGWRRSELYKILRELVTEGSGHQRGALNTARSPLHKDLVVLPQTVSTDLRSRSLPAWPAPSPGRDPEVSFSLSCTNVSKMIRYPPNRQWEEA